jgi:hypothetical protein
MEVGGGRGRQAHDPWSGEVIGRSAVVPEQLAGTAEMGGNRSDESAGVGADQQVDLAKQAGVRLDGCLGDTPIVDQRQLHAFGIGPQSDPGCGLVSLAPITSGQAQGEARRQRCSIAVSTRLVRAHRSTLSPREIILTGRVSSTSTGWPAAYGVRACPRHPTALQP